jgi:hypothetical protein
METMKTSEKKRTSNLVFRFKTRIMQRESTRASPDAQTMNRVTYESDFPIVRINILEEQRMIAVNCAKVNFIPFNNYRLANSDEWEK